MLASAYLEPFFGVPGMYWDNITAAWAVDREFVIYSFLGVVGPMVPPGSPDALGKAKTKVFLRFFKVRSQKQ